MDEIVRPRAPTTWLQAVEAGRADLASRRARASGKDVIARLHEREMRLRAETDQNVEHKTDIPAPRF